MSRKFQHPHSESSAAKKWEDPVKNRPARESTLTVEGDFVQFKELMRKVVGQMPSSSHGPASS